MNIKPKDKVNLIINFIAGLVVFGFLSPVLISAKSTFLVVLGLVIMGAFVAVTYVVSYPIILRFFDNEPPVVTDNVMKRGYTTSNAPVDESFVQATRNKYDTVGRPEVRKDFNTTPRRTAYGTQSTVDKSEDTYIDSSSSDSSSSDSSSSD